VKARSDLRFAHVTLQLVAMLRSNNVRMIFGVVTDWASIKIDEFRERDVPAESNVRGNAQEIVYSMVYWAENSS